MQGPLFRTQWSESSSDRLCTFCSEQRWGCWGWDGGRVVKVEAQANGYLPASWSSQQPESEMCLPISPEDTGSEGLFSGLTASVHQSLLSLACRHGIRLSGAPRGLPHVAMVESPWAGTCPQNQLPEREAVGPYTVEILPWGVSVGPRGFQSQFCENGFFFPS